MRKSILTLILLSSFTLAKAQFIANPLNLNYRFQPISVSLSGELRENSYREAADPVIELFKGKNYLFASPSGGYWSSEDLANWQFIPCRSVDIISGYAPGVFTLGDTLYYMANGSHRIFATTNPDKDEWREIPSQLGLSEIDPALFLDEETGRVYFYWGCSDKDPIMGVEIDPKNGFKPVGEPRVLITHNRDKYGWEVPGENNDDDSRNGWNEAPAMIKYNGQYYLQYAAPGTEFRTYGDGVYVSDSPLGEFTYEESNPFSFKPGGFIGGAGHGHTFYDKYGNLWHVATMRLSVRNTFERRIGLFPSYFSGNGTLHAHTVWTDYPFRAPQKKVDFSKDNLNMDCRLLSYNKKVKSSSSLKNYSPQNANDEAIETWWSAASGKAGEWWQVDLGSMQHVKAIQVNFADHDFPSLNSFAYQYKILCSDDGKTWKTFIDRSDNEKDMPHELIVNNVHTRFLRIINTKDMPHGKFSLYDFRVFGGERNVESKIEKFSVVRDKNDRRIFRFDWKKAPDAEGYILRWGVKPNELHNAVMIRGNSYEGRFFNRDSEYFFELTGF